jgi:alpha/beta superfamily hydrolase
LAAGVPLILVGYSFGSRCVIAHALDDPSVRGSSRSDFRCAYGASPTLPLLRRPLSVVQGTKDEYGSIDEVAAVIRTASPAGRLYEIPGATHLFPGRAQEAATVVAGAVEDMLQG